MDCWEPANVAVRPVLEPELKPVTVDNTDSQKVFQERDDPKSSAKDREDFELEMDETIDGRDLDEINDAITPHKLTKCAINSLEKSFEVSSRLRDLADSKGPDADDLESLSKSVEDYAFHLLEPLKSDEMKKAIFEGNDFDRIADKSVLYKQKKFVSHPVVYNLLMRRWAGHFYHLRYRSLLGKDWFKWILLNLWTVFDVVLFPLIFVLLHLVHLVVGFVKKRQKFHVVFLYKASWKYAERSFQTMKDLSAASVDKLMPRVGSIRIVHLGQEDSNVVGDVDKAKTLIQDLNQDLNKTNGKSVIADDLEITKRLLENADASFNKVLVFMTDDACGVSINKLSKEVEALHGKPVNVISVGVGVHSQIKELETMATNEENVILYLADMKRAEVCDKLIGCFVKNDIYDRYVQYFNTPYFVFVRDTLSYLALLGLHFAICLQPSTLHFSALEWVIMLFFLGRLMMEVNQAVMESTANKLSVYNTTSMLKRKEKQQTRRERFRNKLLEVWSRYIRDQWNILDIVILTVFAVLLVLRCVTWSSALSVSKNRLLAVAGYLYGLNAMFLTLRVFGHIMESKKSTGSIQIALYQIIGAVLAIFGQFLAAILAFSLAITKIYMAEISFTAGTNATSHGFCEDQNGLSCWWSSTTHLTWSVLGIAELDPLKSSDGASDILAKLLYGIFLIMGVVMLMNMMIALLSNTYQKVQDNSFYEWSYKKATTIRTYTKYHPVPVPFNIISLSVKFFLHIYKKCCKKDTNLDNTDGVTRTESRMTKNIGSVDSLFDCLVTDLQSDYFAANGYAFPMADGNKIDRVVKETEGSHQLIGHIAQRVFKYNRHEEKQIESHHIAEWESKGIDVTGQRMSYVPCDCWDCADVGEVKNHGAKYLTPLSRELPGFEVLIQESGERRFISIGVVTDIYELHQFPGWHGNTAGYHIDDGKVFDYRDYTLGRECDDAMAYRGDLIGCELLYDKQTDRGMLPVSFTLNGRVIGQAQVDNTSTDFHAYVGIGWKGISLVFRWLPKAFSSRRYSISRPRSMEFSQDPVFPITAPDRHTGSQALQLSRNSALPVIRCMKDEEVISSQIEEVYKEVIAQDSDLFEHKSTQTNIQSKLQYLLGRHKHGATSLLFNDIVKRYEYLSGIQRDEPTTKRLDEIARQLNALILEKERTDQEMVFVLGQVQDNIRLLYNSKEVGRTHLEDDIRNLDYIISTPEDSSVLQSLQGISEELYCIMEEQGDGVTLQLLVNSNKKLDNIAEQLDSLIRKQEKLEEKVAVLYHK